MPGTPPTADATAEADEPLSPKPPPTKFPPIGRGGAVPWEEVAPPPAKGKCCNVHFVRVFIGGVFLIILLAHKYV